MKATVTKLLNRRIGSPSVNAPKLTPLEVGTFVEIAATVKGDKIDGNDVWYQTADGYYVWSGGIEVFLTELNKSSVETIDINTKPQTNETFDLFKKLQTNSEELKGDGNQITIAILDTGISRHKAIKDRILFDKSQSFLDSDADINDVNGHGTNVAGIIGGDCQEMKGIATRSWLINYKVINNSGFVDSDAIYSAIKNIAQKELNTIDIINLSLDINNKLFPYILNDLNIIQSKGVILVVAAGNNNDFNNVAFIENVIKVGVFDIEKFEEIKNNTSNKTYSCLYVNQPIFTCSINNTFGFIESSSAYTAVTTGIIASFLSDPNNRNIPKAKRLEEIQKFLDRISLPIASQAKPELYKIYKP